MTIDIAREQKTKEHIRSVIVEFNKEQDEKRAKELIPISVSEAIRKHEGRHHVTGVIVSRSELYDMITKTIFTCSNDSCNSDPVVVKYKHPMPNVEEEDRKCEACEAFMNMKHSYITAVNVWLEDENPKAEFERLPVVLFDKDNENIGVGEHVTITGNIHIFKAGGKNNKKLVPILHAESISYHHREELTLSNADVVAIKKFAFYPNLMERLTSMVALPVVGHQHPKKGILIAALGSARVKSRVPFLFAGDPGEAKTLLIRHATDLIPNSKYSSGQHSSTKSITAIIDRENDMYVLKHGPAAMAKYAFCAINELGTLSFEDQTRLYDVMEEGAFNLNKHGFYKPIDAPTTIIATTNQIGATWKETDKISDSELPIIKPLVDRFDLIFVFRTENSPEANRQFAYEASEREGKEIFYNYSFLRKFIHYAKAINPTFTEEAKAMLNEFWIQVATDQDFSSKRKLFALYRIAKAFARMALKDIVDTEAAKDTIEFYNEVLVQYGRRLTTPISPRDLTLQEVRRAILKMQVPIDFREAIKEAANANAQVKAYLGKKLTADSNKKVRAVQDIVKQSPGDDIIILSLKPLVLIRSDRSDKSDGKNPSDPYDLSDQKKHLRCAKCSYGTDDGNEFRVHAAGHGKCE